MAKIKIVCDSSAGLTDEEQEKVYKAYLTTAQKELQQEIIQRLSNL